MQNDDLQEKPLAQETAQTSQELSWTASEFIEHKKEEPKIVKVIKKTK